MIIYPAIDLYNGKVVRLQRGQFENETIYSNDPVSMAQKWEDEGAEWVHIVDLEGAKTGAVKNLEMLFRIRKSVKCRLQFGGGVRLMEDVDKMVTAGINRVVIGTKALDNDFLKKVLTNFRAQVAVSLDTKHGLVQTEGWLRDTNQSVRQVIDILNEFSLETLIYTDIQKDGMLEGPNFTGLGHILEWSRSRVILSGGISSLKDIEKCHKIKNLNFDGVIVGKALYDQKFALQDAIRLTVS